jgi:RNA polymerase sigma-70 factor, ECF subfamily
MPDEPEVLGLLALMLLVESRRPARSPDEVILLADQDRTRWNRELIAEGQAIVRRCLFRGQPGPNQLQAAINAVHSDAPTVAATDWRQVVALYDQLLALQPSPIVALNRAVAIAELHGPAPALALVDALDLDDHHRYHAVRAYLLRRLDRPGEAAAVVERAVGGAANDVERAFLQRRLDELHGTQGASRSSGRTATPLERRRSLRRRT